MKSKKIINTKLDNSFHKVFKSSIKNYKKYKFSEGKWDSLKHINLLIQIEIDFDLKFTKNEVSKLITYLKFKEFLENINDKK